MLKKVSENTVPGGEQRYFNDNFSSLRKSVSRFVFGLFK